MLPVCPRRPYLPSQPRLTSVGAVPDSSLAGARASQRRSPRWLRHSRYTQPLNLYSAPLHPYPVGGGGGAEALRHLLHLCST